MAIDSHDVQQKTDAWLGQLRASLRQDQQPVLERRQELNLSLARDQQDLSVVISVQRPLSR